MEKDFPGFTVGKKEDKLGIRASSTCELILEDCRVPSRNLLGETGKGYKIAIETLNEGRIGIGAQMLGLARGALEQRCKYAQERKQFGQPIANFQAIQFELAQMGTEIEAARLMVYNAARMKDAGMNFVKEAAMTKLFASQVARAGDGGGGRDLRRLWFHKRLSGGEVLPRCQDWRHLRGHVEHAIGDHRQAGAGQVGQAAPFWFSCGWTRLDTACYVSTVMFDEFKERCFASPPRWRRLVMAGCFGRKIGNV